MQIAHIRNASLKILHGVKINCKNILNEES